MTDSSEPPANGGQGLVPSNSVSPGNNWTILASTGRLVIGRSETEFAVYDGTTTYGRWPLTEQGHQLAAQMYNAYAHSPAAGLAYSVTGYQDPARLGLPTEPAIKSQTYSAPLSFVGSTRRIVSWASKTAQRSSALAVLAWAGGILFLILAWVFILAWYLVVFGLFGVFVIPYRLVRRSQRKSLHVQRTALATQQAMLQQQQAMWQQMAPRPDQEPPPGLVQPQAPGTSPLTPIPFS